MSPLLPSLAEPSDVPALRFADGTLSYRQLAATASRLATRLAGFERVAVWALPSVATAAGVVAGLLAGVPVVPVNPKAGEWELGHILADAAPQAVLAAPGTALPGAFDEIPRIDVMGSAIESRAPHPLPDEALDSAPALIIYTSGTTGAPKGAVLSRGALAANLDALAEAWEWTAADRLAHALPLFHVHGLVLGTLGPLRLGGSVHHLAAADGVSVAAAIGDGASMLFGVPTQYHRLAADLEADPLLAEVVGCARLLVSGSAALTAVDHARIEKATGLAVRERYGLTETLILTAARAGEAPEPGTVGRAVEGTEVRLVPLEEGSASGPASDAAVEAGSTGVGHSRAADDGLGSVQARGSGLFSGYLNRPEATAAAMTPDGWFVTGDIGRWTPSGALALVGRKATDLIKSGGYKIGAGEIENALLEHPAVAEVAIVGEPDDDLGERIVGYVVAAGAAPEPEELIRHVAVLLAPHKRPRDIRYVNSLPRNAMGKIQKKKLLGG